MKLLQFNCFMAGALSYAAFDMLIHHHSTTAAIGNLVVVCVLLLNRKVWL